MIRMGLKKQAHEVLQSLFEGLRPPGWNGWAEVVWRDPRAPKFIGDLPHSWVGAEFIRSVRTMFAYEREGDQALVVGAGLLPEWVLSEQRGQRPPAADLLWHAELLDPAAAAIASWWSR